MEYTRSSRSMSFPARLSPISFSEVSGTLLAQTKISKLSSPIVSPGQALAPASFSNSRAGEAPAHRSTHLLLHQFRQVDGSHFSFHARHLDGVFDIHHAERACRYD